MKSFGAMEYASEEWKYIQVKRETMGNREKLYMLLHLTTFFPILWGKCLKFLFITIIFYFALGLKNILPSAFSSYKNIHYIWTSFLVDCGVSLSPMCNMWYGSSKNKFPFSVDKTEEKKDIFFTYDFSFIRKKASISEFSQLLTLLLSKGDSCSSKKEDNSLRTWHSSFLLKATLRAGKARTNYFEKLWTMCATTMNTH